MKKWLTLVFVLAVLAAAFIYFRNPPPYPDPIGSALEKDSTPDTPAPPRQ